LWIETAELLHYRMAQITPRTMLWVISQSGASVEIVRLMEAIKTAPPDYFLGITNNMASLLAQQCSVTLPLSAGDEFTVSTKTYVTSLAVAQLAALELLGQSLDGPLSEFSGAVELMQVYLDRLPEFVHELREEFSVRYQRCVLLGRGRSMAAALNGSLVLKEAAKVIIEGMSVAHFLHGPLELVDKDLSVLLLAGDERTTAINRGLARDVVRYGGKVFWIGYQPEETLPSLRLPHVSDLVLPLFEILPIQLMTIAFGELNGVQPGMFRHIGKVTDTE
jgi:glucosamine--fructose-6-phosphate aminotransferase (isomerizing)